MSHGATDQLWIPIYETDVEKSIKVTEVRYLLGKIRWTRLSDVTHHILTAIEDRKSVV